MVCKKIYPGLVAVLWFFVSGAGTLYGEEKFQMNTLTMETATGKSLGVASAKDDMTAIFTAQKRFVYQILKQIGVSENDLPPAVKAAINKPQTTSMAAFETFSEGLDQMDKGQFATAETLFSKAAALDPGFAMAKTMEAAMPKINLVIPPPILPSATGGTPTGAPASGPTGGLPSAPAGPMHSNTFDPDF